jgi:pimeloyl-ACP methyl ester carboxylesterase
VIAFDRPGYGRSSRPRDRLWTPFAQAAVFHAALRKLGIEQAVAVGHSMGTMAALAMALNHPANVRRLVLIGGYFYPESRLDALVTASVALPVLGDVMRYTVTALSGRAMIGSLAKSLFAPKDVPADFFQTLSREMMLRPVQLRANAEDAAFMMQVARAISRRYKELRLPVAIVAGSEDSIVDMESRSGRLHRELPQSELHVLPGTGHMVHYSAQGLIVSDVDNPRASQLPLPDALVPGAKAGSLAASSGRGLATHHARLAESQP